MNENSEDQQEGTLSLTPQERSPRDNQADIALSKPPVLNLDEGSETNKSNHVIYQHTYEIKDELEEPGQQLVLSVSTPPSEREEPVKSSLIQSATAKKALKVSAGLLLSSAVGFLLYNRLVKRS